MTLPSDPAAKPPAVYTIRVRDLGSKIPVAVRLRMLLKVLKRMLRFQAVGFVTQDDGAAGGETSAPDRPRGE